MRRPAPYIYHFSEDWCERFGAALSSNEPEGISSLGLTGDGQAPHFDTADLSHWADHLVERVAALYPLPIETV
jgi:hypothetical protein